MTTDTRNNTPTLIQTLQSVIDASLCELHTALPCEIVSYDYAKNLAVVQPVLKRKYKNEDEAVELPTISNVPVSFQRMGPAHLRLPIKPGQTGQLVFNERSIDGWLVSGGKIDPQDPRKHSLSDAVFYPGLNPSNKPMESSAAEDSVELKLNGAHVEILSSGKFKITNGTEEAFDLLVQILGKVIEEMTEQGENDFTNTIFGPLQPINFAKYTALKGDYEELKTKMETLKG
jgi:hypothetical protein